MEHLENEYLKIGVNLFGAELVSVFNKEIGREVMWEGDPAYWDRVSPHLFPIVGKVFNKEYKVDGESYSLPQHGFLRDQTFEIVDKTENSLTYRFQSNHELMAVYPYHHAVEITYTLNAKRVEVMWDVINLDDKVMYYSIGAHPGFAVDKTHKYQIEYECDGPNQQVILEKGFVKELVDVTIKPISVDESTFINDAVMYTGVSAVSLVDLTENYRVRMDFKGFEFIAVWSSMNSGSMAPFICLEPWRGIVDDLGGFDDISQKRGIQKVEANSNSVNTYGIEF